MKTEVLLKSVLASSLIFGIVGCGDSTDDKTIKKEQIEENKNDKAKDNQIINNEPNKDKNENIVINNKNLDNNNEPNNNQENNISDKKDNNHSKKSEKDINNKNNTKENNISNKEDNNNTIDNKKINEPINKENNQTDIPNINDDKNNSKDNQKHNTQDTNKPNDNKKDKNNKPNKDDKKQDDDNKTDTIKLNKDNNTTNINEPNKDNNKTKIDSNTSNPKNDTTLKSLILYTPNIQALKDNNISLSLKDDKGNAVKNNITWIVTPKDSIIQYKTSNIITPIKDINITLQAKYNNILSNPITLQVKWIVNGHTLPPMPDEKINNSTLLGIDVNDNGVRDDVERKIYETYKRPIEQAYMMQFGKRFPKTLENPKEAAQSQDIEQEMWRQYSCRGILRKKGIRSIIKTVDFMENAYFNTKDRIKAYLQYNQTLSGGVYNIPFHDKDYDEKNCDFNVTKLLEMEK